MTALPDWGDLSEHDKAQVVLFIRTSEDEGVDYAWENYPPEWDMNSPLRAIDDAWKLRRGYNVKYGELYCGREYWRLYEIALAS